MQSLAHPASLGGADRHLQPGDDQQQVALARHLIDSRQSGSGASLPSIRTCQATPMSGSKRPAPCPLSKVGDTLGERKALMKAKPSCLVPSRAPARQDPRHSLTSHDRPARPPARATSMAEAFFPVLPRAGMGKGQPQREGESDIHGSKRKSAVKVRTGMGARGFLYLKSIVHYFDPFLRRVRVFSCCSSPSPSPLYPSHASELLIPGKSDLSVALTQPASLLATPRQPHPL